MDENIKIIENCIVALGSMRVRVDNADVTDTVRAVIGALSEVRKRLTDTGEKDDEV